VDTRRIIMSIEGQDLETPINVNNKNYFKFMSSLMLGIIIIFSDTAAQGGLWPSRSRGFLITHNDAPQSVGILWTSDQLVAETST
jgi:hypothetical protein